MNELPSALSTLAAGPDQQTVLVNIALFVAVLTYVLHRQLSIRAVTPRTFLLVTVLFVVGIVDGLPTTATGGSLLVVSVALSAGFGVWRGTSMRMWRTGNGVVYRRGTAVTLVLWAITVTTKTILDGVEMATTHTFTTGPIWLAMAITLAVQQYVMLHRAKTLASD